MNLLAFIKTKKIPDVREVVPTDKIHQMWIRCPAKYYQLKFILLGGELLPGILLTQVNFCEKLLRKKWQKGKIQRSEH